MSTETTVTTTEAPEVVQESQTPAEATLVIEAVTTAAEASATAEAAVTEVEKIAEETTEELEAVAAEVERIESWQRNLTEMVGTIQASQAEMREMCSKMSEEIQMLKTTQPIQSLPLENAEDTSGTVIVPDVLPADPLNPPANQEPASEKAPEIPAQNRKAQRTWI